MTHGPASLPCKVCGAAAPFLDSCDFNAHCERAASPRLLPSSGVAVPYYRCPHCGFMFTPFMDGFSRQDFAERVYNPDYRLVDPDFEERRPAALAAYLLNHFGTLPLSICDYGGGSGRMAVRGEVDPAHTGPEGRGEAQRARLTAGVEHGAAEIEVGGRSRGRPDGHHFGVRRGIVIPRDPVDALMDPPVGGDHQRPERPAARCRTSGSEPDRAIQEAVDVRG